MVWALLFLICVLFFFCVILLHSYSIFYQVVRRVCFLPLPMLVHLFVGCDCCCLWFGFQNMLSLGADVKICLWFIMIYILVVGVCAFIMVLSSNWIWILWWFLSCGNLCPTYLCLIFGMVSPICGYCLCCGIIVPVCALCFLGLLLFFGVLFIVHNTAHYPDLGCIFVVIFWHWFCLAFILVCFCTVFVF